MRWFNKSTIAKTNFITQFLILTFGKHAYWIKIGMIYIITILFVSIDKISLVRLTTHLLIYILIFVSLKLGSKCLFGYSVWQVICFRGFVIISFFRD